MSNAIGGPSSLLNWARTPTSASTAAASKTNAAKGTDEGGAAPTGLAARRVAVESFVDPRRPNALTPSDAAARVGVLRMRLARQLETAPRSERPSGKSFADLMSHFDRRLDAERARQGASGDLVAVDGVKNGYGVFQFTPIFASARDKND